MNKNSSVTGAWRKIDKAVKRAIDGYRILSKSIHKSLRQCKEFYKAIETFRKLEDKKKGKVNEN